MISLHSQATPKRLSDEVEVHGVRLTFEQAVAQGLMLVNVDAEGVIQHAEIINPNTDSYKAKDGEELPGYPGTVVKQN